MPLVCWCEITWVAFFALIKVVVGLAAVLGARTIWEMLRVDCCVRRICRAAGAARRDNARSEDIRDELAIFVEGSVFSQWFL